MISFVSSSVQVVVLVSLLFRTIVGDFVGPLRSDGEGRVVVLVAVVVSVEYDDSGPTEDATDTDDNDAADE